VAATGQTRGQTGAKVAETAEAIRAAMPTLDMTEQQISAAIHRLMADGVPATSEAIARASGTTVDRVDESLSSWPGVYRDDKGQVVGFWGHAIAPLTPSIAFIPSSGRRRVAEHEGTTLLSVEEAFQLGREITMRIAPDLFGARN